MSDFETVPPGTLELFEKVTAERDTLAAHLNAPVIDNAIEALGHAQYWQEQEELESWKAGTPTTSLACLKAKWQAEALEEAAKEFGRFRGMDHSIQPCELDDRAAELRRQAEE